MSKLSKGEITRDKVVSETIDLVLKKGFSNTSISDIINYTGVKKGNLYFHFSSKEALGVAVLDAILAQSKIYLKDGLRGPSPLEKIANYLDSVYARHERKNFVGGCLVGNTAIEMGDLNPDFAAKVTEMFSYWQATLSRVLEEATEAGELDHPQPAAMLAKHIIAVIEGGIMMAKASKDGRDLKDCLDSLKNLLGIPA